MGEVWGSGSVLTEFFAFARCNTLCILVWKEGVIVIGEGLQEWARVKWM